MRYLSVACSIVVGALTFAGPRAHAQSYPTKPIRVIVPFAAGGAVDALARLVTAKLQEAVGQPVIVENRAGAGGNTGADQVAKSPPDGYTILQHTNGQAISPALYRSLPFDPLKDFIPVIQLVGTSTVLVANPKFPAKSLKELIALAKEKPGKLNYGMTGVGNSLHLTMEMLKRAAGIDILAIPYRGDAPLNTALIAGEVDVAIVPIGTAVPLLESGRLRPLAVNSAQRSPALPDVPTVAEEAIPGFEAAGWQGWFVPAKTPRDVVAYLQRETAKVIADPDMQARLKAMGNEPVGSTTEAFDGRFKSDLAKFAKVVKEANIPTQD
jgi:tripartite-type tricarboxylate transporter receptor subunit TctC